MMLHGRTEQIKFLFKLSFTAAAAMFLFWKCNPFNSITSQHENICRLHAKTIVHDQNLWAEYAKGAEKAFQERKRDFPETGRAVAEYVPGFEMRFGKRLTTDRNFRIGEIVRDDVVLLKDRILVVSFVDFTGSYDTIETRQFLTCLGNYKSNYDRISMAHE